MRNWRNCSPAPNSGAAIARARPHQPCRPIGSRAPTTPGSAALCSAGFRGLIPQVCAIVATSGQGTGFHETFSLRAGIIPARCGAIDLATADPAAATMPVIRFGDRPAPARADNDEDAMTRKFPAASKLAALLAAAALVAVGATSASAQSKQRYDKDGRPYLRSEWSQPGRTSRAAPASTSPRARGSMPAPKCCRATASSGLRLSVAVRVPNVRAREQQSPDRPPAAQPAVGYGRLSRADPAAAVLIAAVACSLSSLRTFAGTHRHGFWS